MRTIYQCFVSGASDIGTHFSCLSAILFPNRDDAEHYLPTFIAKCREKRTLANLEELHGANVVERQLADSYEDAMADTKDHR